MVLPCKQNASGKTFKQALFAMKQMGIKHLPYLFEYKSHFFVPKHQPKSQVRLIHEVHCMPYKNFLKYFLGIDLYAVAFHSIISLIAFHASKVALLMLSPFFHILSRLVITYPH